MTFAFPRWNSFSFVRHLVLKMNRTDTNASPEKICPRKEACKTARQQGSATWGFLEPCMSPANWRGPYAPGISCWLVAKCPDGQDAGAVRLSPGQSLRSLHTSAPLQLQKSTFYPVFANHWYSGTMLRVEAYVVFNGPYYLLSSGGKCSRLEKEQMLFEVPFYISVLKACPSEIGEFWRLALFLTSLGLVLNPKHLQELGWSLLFYFHVRKMSRYVLKSLRWTLFGWW